MILSSLEEPGEELLGFSLPSFMYVSLSVIFLQVVVVVDFFFFLVQKWKKKSVHKWD